MREWKTYQRQSKGDEWVRCDAADFDAERSDNPVQCYCEQQPQPVPNPCGNEGEDCLCNGIVYYMKQYQEVNRPTDFMNAKSEYEFAVNTANTSGHTKCSKESFEDVNPLPSEKKHCFCDQSS